MRTDLQRKWTATEANSEELQLWIAFSKGPGFAAAAQTKPSRQEARERAAIQTLAAQFTPVAFVFHTGYNLLFFINSDQRRGQKSICKEKEENKKG